jgi:ADP-ribose pyrophosphatase YjhB (NUDIX family)
MLAFQHAKGRFNYRTVGVLLHQQSVLVHRAETDSFWTLPGGRVEFDESAQTGLIRELQEELEVVATVERLLWVVENFFSYEAQPYHELAFYFLATLPSDSALYATTRPFQGQEPGIRLIFQWYPLVELHTLDLYPSFLRQGLQALPTSTTYIVHRDG